MKSRDMTVTQGRMEQAMEKLISPHVTSAVNSSVKTEVEKTKLRMGVVTKYYPYINKAEVKLENNIKVLCKLPHNFVGALIDFYTPVGTRAFCSKLKEPYIIPRGGLPCVVLPIHNSDEYFIVSYYIQDEIVGLSPASMGTIRISYLSATNEHSVEFGLNGLELNLPTKFETTVGRLEQDMEKVDYVEKSEVYSKEEVDEIIEHIPHGDMSDYVRKDEILTNYGVDFTYSFGVGGIEDSITIEPFLIEK